MVSESELYKYEGIWCKSQDKHLRIQHFDCKVSKSIYQIRYKMASESDKAV